MDKTSVAKALTDGAVKSTQNLKDAVQAGASPTASVLNHITDKVSAGLDHVSHVVEQAMPKALELAVKGVYTIGAADLVAGVILLVVALTLLTVGIRAGRKADWQDGSFDCFVCVPSLISGCILFIVTLCFLCDTDSWARVISPDGYLAQQVVSRILH